VLLVVAVYVAEDRVAAVVGVRVSERRQSVRRKRAVNWIRYGGTLSK